MSFSVEYPQVIYEIESNRGGGGGRDGNAGILVFLERSCAVQQQQIIHRWGIRNQVEIFIPISFRLNISSQEFRHWADPVQYPPLLLNEFISFHSNRKFLVVSLRWLLNESQWFPHTSTGALKDLLPLLFFVSSPSCHRNPPGFFPPTGLILNWARLTESNIVKNERYDWITTTG